MKFISLFLISSIIFPLTILSQNRFSVTGHTKRSYGARTYLKIDPAYCLGDLRSYKLNHDNYYQIFDDTACKDNQFYLVYCTDGIYYSPKEEFLDRDEIDSNLRNLKIAYPNTAERLDSLKIETNRLNKKETEKLDSLQKILDKSLALARSKNLVLWQWSWSYPNEYSHFADVSIEVLNPYKSKIKYISFTIKAFNPVGDVVRDEIKGTTSKTVKGVGPIEYGDHGEYNFENVIYSKVIDKMKITQISIQFFDGSVKVINNPVEINHENSD